MNNYQEKIKELTSLEIGWDGYNGVPVSQKLADIASNLLKELPNENWQLVPGSDGSIQIEIHKKYYSIEIDITHAK